jgi:UDP-N-acetylmuramyl tripeptide synthase
LFLSKNPTGFNASLRTIQELGATHIFLVLNDRIPDGRDVSWIWDVDFEGIQKLDVYVAGDRVYDLALRLQYADAKPKVVDVLEKGLHQAINALPKDETLYVLATYSAMLEVRKILTGKKIL